MILDLYCHIERVKKEFVYFGPGGKVFTLEVNSLLKPCCNCLALRQQVRQAEIRSRLSNSVIESNIADGQGEEEQPYQQQVQEQRLVHTPQYERHEDTQQQTQESSKEKS